VFAACAGGGAHRVWEFAVCFFEVGECFGSCELFAVVDVQDDQVAVVCLPGDDAESAVFELARVPAGDGGRVVGGGFGPA